MKQIIFNNLVEDYFKEEPTQKIAPQKEVMIQFIDEEGVFYIKGIVYNWK